MPNRRYVKHPGESKGHYLPCPTCGKVRCECLELDFLARLRKENLPAPDEREFKFCSGRGWKADFAYTPYRVLVEVEGGGTIGRHTSITGYRDDCIKYNVASLLGWKVLRFDKDMIKRGIAVETIRAVLNGTVFVPEVIGKRSQKRSEKSRKRLKMPGNAENASGNSFSWKVSRIDPTTLPDQLITDPVEAAIRAAKNSMGERTGVTANQLRKGRIE